MRENKEIYTLKHSMDLNNDPQCTDLVCVPISLSTAAPPTGYPIRIEILIIRLDRNTSHKVTQVNLKQN